MASSSENNLVVTFDGASLWKNEVALLEFREAKWKILENTLMERALLSLDDRQIDEQNIVVMPDYEINWMHACKWAMSMIGEVYEENTTYKLCQTVVPGNRRLKEVKKRLIGFFVINGVEDTFYSEDDYYTNNKEN